MTDKYTVLYDPEGVIVEELPLDREPHMSLVKAVLALPESPDALPPDDCAQIALQLTGHARVVAAEVRRLCDALPQNMTRVLTETVLADADTLLGTPAEQTIKAVQKRANMVRGLYEGLDRLAVEPVRGLYERLDRLAVEPPHSAI